MPWVSQNAAVATAYCLTAWCCIWVTMPQAALPMFWAPSGIALMAVYRLGPRVSPAIFIAGFLVFARFLELDFRTAAAAQFLAPLAMGCAAAAQALAGVALARRFLGPGNLVTGGARLALVFLGLGGPIAVILNATVGSSLLASLGLLGESTWGTVWKAWWLSEALGVTIVAPLLFCWVGDGRPSWSARVVGAMGIVISIAVCLGFHAGQKRALEARFVADAEARVAAIQKELEHGFDAVRTVRGLFAASQRVERHEFRDFVAPILSGHAALHALSWNPILRGDQLHEHSMQVRRQGHADYQVRQLTPDGTLVPAIPGAFHVVVEFIEPFEVNRQALGLDIASQLDRRDALFRAIRSRDLQLTSALRLVQQSDRPGAGFLALLPVHANGADPTGEPNGFVTGVFLAEEVLERALENLDAVGIDVGLYEVRSSGDPQLLALHQSAAVVPQQSREAVMRAQLEGRGIHKSESRDVGGRRLRIVCTPIPFYMTRYAGLSPLAALLVGLLASALLSSYMADGTYRSRRVEALVTERTQELWQSNDQLRHEIQDRRQAEEALARANEQAIAATHAKSTFLANMSHEIRTPMNGVVGMAAILGETRLTDEQQDCLETLQYSADLLLNIIDDILDFSKIEAGMLRLELTPIDLKELVAGVRGLLQPRAEEKQLTLAMRFEESAPRWVLGDGSRISQIVTNLVGNAIKFTEEGFVRIEVGCVSRTARRATIRIDVIDTGIGVSGDDVSRLFEQFTQADVSTSRKYGGSGLGLAISKELTELMGGRIGASGKPGKGSQFFVEIPFELAPEARAPSSDQPAARFDGMRVLLAEDNAVNRKVAAKLLERRGCEVDVAHDGAEALAKVSSQRFDLVLMDCHMPNMDGYEATRRIRAAEAETDAVPVRIVALTANANSDDRQRCLDVGMDGYLAKPISFRPLEEALEQARDASVHPA